MSLSLSFKRWGLRVFTVASLIVGAVAVSPSVNYEALLFGQHPIKDPALRGGPYKPRDAKVASDLSDWDVLDFEEREIKSVRLVGEFAGYKTGKTVDHSTTKQAVRCTVQKALNSYAVMRPGVSDIGTGGSAVGGGAHLGVLAITPQKGDVLIIGVGRVGFYLGTCYGSQRQTFYSAVLARQVDELFFEATGKRLTKEDMDSMSGIRIIEDNNRIFDECRALGKKKK